MKKMFLGPISILTIIFFCALLNGINMQKHTARWSESLQQAVLSVQSENFDSAKAALNSSYEDWLKMQTYLHIVLEHEVIDNAEAMYQRAFAFTTAKDSQELQAELADLIHQLTLLSEMERLSIKNIL